MDAEAKATCLCSLANAIESQKRVLIRANCSSSLNGMNPFLQVVQIGNKRCLNLGQNDHR